MAQECGFFNAELEGGEYDRVYNAEQFAAYFASFIGNGIFGNSMSELVVVENETPNMSVNVSSGKAWINGWWYRNTEDYNLSVDVADGILNRIDIVVLRWGNVERDMWLQVIKGTPSAEPTAPSITRDADYYDLKLCEISVPAGAINIRQAQITDTRAISDVCGFVTGLIDQIDATDLFLQFQAQFGDFMNVSFEEFNIWFQHMKDQLSEDAAGHLQAEIDALAQSSTRVVECTEEEYAELTEEELMDGTIRVVGDEDEDDGMHAAVIGFDPTECNGVTAENIQDAVTQLDNKVYQSALIPIDQPHAKYSPGAASTFGAVIAGLIAQPEFDFSKIRNTSYIVKFEEDSAGNVSCLRYDFEIGITNTNNNYWYFRFKSCFSSASDFDIDTYILTNQVGYSAFNHSSRSSSANWNNVTTGANFALYLFY